MNDAGPPGVKLPPPLIYIAGFLLGLALEALVPIGSLPFGLALAAAIVGVAIFLALDGSAMVHFIRAKTGIVPISPTTAFVTSGPFRITRNPMYLGMAFLYVGLALALGVIWALAFLPVVLLVVDRYVIPPEERFLEAKFGDEYREYKGGVRRWI